MIESKGVILRSLSISDIEKLLEWHNNFQIKKLALMHPFPVSLELERKHLETQLTSTNNTMILLGIEEKRSNELIGFTKLYNINWVHRTTYFGIVIGDESARGKGYGQETTVLMLNYAFRNLNLHKILLEVAAFNKEAINLYKKIGFENEGILKKQIYLDGSYHDLLIMSIIRDGFEDKN